MLYLPNFPAHEFNLTKFGGEDWWPKMSRKVLESLQAVRNFHGQPVSISPHKAALGRRNGPASASDHNIDRWGEVRCADVFPANVSTPDDARKFVDMAFRAGFNSVGVYPHWRNGRGQQQCGFHLGFRPDATRNATWGFVRETLHGPQRMVGMEEALSLVGSPIPS